MRGFLLCGIAALALAAVTVAAPASAGREEWSDYSYAEQQILQKYAQKVYTKILSYRLTKSPKMNSGLVVVKFKISPSGKLQTISVVRSSGEKNKDMLAMKWVWTAAPFPPPPKVPGFDNEFSLPINFINLRFR